MGISNRPTAIVAPAGPTRSLSAFFSSKSSVKKAAMHQFRSNDITMPSSLIPNLSSAFQPIHSIQNLLHRQASLKTAPVLLDIPQHKPLERVEELHHVHISHPQSPSIVHVGSRARNEAKLRRGTSLRFVSDEARRSEARFLESRTRRGEAEIRRGEAKRFEKCCLDIFSHFLFLGYP